MKINILGGGPASLYFSILMKKRDPAHAITIFERDGPDDTFGWGIVFSGRTFQFLEEKDPPSYAQIAARSQTWEDVIIGHPQETIAIGGNAFSGIARLSFLNILQQRCIELGVDLRYQTNIAAEQLPVLRECDLFVGADGANSMFRKHYEDLFLPTIDLRQNKYVWLGTPQVFDGLAMYFRENAAGVFIAHAYRFVAADAPLNGACSTFVVECAPETWLRAGLDKMGEADTCAYLAQVFAEPLQGQALLANKFLRWLNFPIVKNKRWHSGNLVLLGDALHTAHFSIGSGTKLALEDAAALADAFAEGPGVPAALAEFERKRKRWVDEFQEAALRSLTWLENVGGELAGDPVAFAYRAQTRSKRVGYGRVKRTAPDFAARYDSWRERQPPAAGPVPAEWLDLFCKRSFGHLATLMADGTPHVTPVWVDYDGAHVLVNSARGRLKDKHMEARPDVALEIQDPDNPNRYLLVRGAVVSISEADADEQLDAMSPRYLNRERYPAGMRFPGEVRRLYRIKPKSVVFWDPFG